MLLTACSGAADGKSAAEEGPLSKYLSAFWDDEAYTQETYDKQNRETEELVAACMADEGFEYIPNTDNGGFLFSDDEESEGPEWGSKEFAEQYGYGIIDWPGRDTQESSDEDQPDEYFDPNQDYVDALSESEQTAYYEALHGPQPTEEEWLEIEESGGGYEYNWETSGCYGAAQHEVQDETNGYQAASEDPEFSELLIAMQEVWTPFYDDQLLHEDVLKLNRDWADCMADKGLSEFSSPNAAQQTLYDEHNALQLPDGDAGEWVEISKDDEKKFQQREIEIAVADIDCKTKLSYDGKIEKLTFDAEQKFLDENKAELDAMIAKYGVKNTKD